MERRDALRYTALLMGVGMSASSIAAILAGCQVDTTDDWKPSFFSQADIEFIREIGETILPKTSTPGAKDAMVDRYLDTIRPLRFTPEENLEFKEKLSLFRKETETSIGSDFTKVDAAKRLEWLTTYDKISFETLKANPDLPAEDKPFYITLKENILGGYFSSEVVAKEYFAFDPIPGRYDACIPLAEVGKAWAI